MNPASLACARPRRAPRTRARLTSLSTAAARAASSTARVARAARNTARTAALAGSLAAVLLAPACSSSKSAGDCRVRATESPASSGAQLLFEHPDALSGFWSHPWPSDARVANAHLIVGTFPNPTKADTLTGYLRTIQESTGAYSRNAALYLAFDRPLDPASLPADPRASTADDAALFLVDIDADSPQRGRRIPVGVRFHDAATVYLPTNHVTILPPFGVSLRPGTTYAVLGTTALRGADGEPVSAPDGLHTALDDGCADSEDGVVRAFAPLRAWLADGGLDRDAIAVATVFTTQDAVADARALAASARAEPIPAVEGLRALRVPSGKFYAMIGQLDMPAYQAGAPPFTNVTDGGGLVRNADGSYQRTGSQRTGVSFAIPVGTPPPGGWPVVLFSHGTGGSHMDIYDAPICLPLVEAGLAVVGYDGVVHGPRNPTGASTDISFFNLFNIIAGRNNPLQGAVDNVVMTKLLRSGLELPQALVSAPDPLRFDPERVGYLGHSQGGLVGAPFAAVEPDVKVAVFSGTAGVLTITLEERKDPVDFLGLLRTLLSLPETEIVDDTHPVLTLIQTFIEAADPIAYGPAWAGDPASERGLDVLQIEGFLDFASPARGHEALASAAGIPLAPPFHRQPPSSALLGIANTEDGAVQGNVTLPSGAAVTMGLIQYPEQTHFPIYDDEDANKRMVEFLRSALIEGRARLIPPTAP